AALIDINVGVELNSAAGGNHSITFTDPNGTLATIALTRGVADVTFGGSGTATTDRAGRVRISGISGGGVTITNIALSNTTTASVLVVRPLGRAGITVGAVSDAAPLSALVAPGVTFTGAVNLA